MSSRVERESAITLGGVAAMGGVVALCLIGLGQTTRAVPTPSALLFLGWVAAAGLIIVLARVRLPRPLKMACIIATIGVMFLLAARSDLFTMKRVVEKIEDPTSTENSTVSTPASKHETGANTPGGAALRLRPSPDGDLGWTALLEKEIGGDVGGPSAGWLTIAGNVTARGSAGETTVVVGWNIAGNGSPVSCGVTSVIGREKAAIASGVRMAFETAAVRSGQQGKPVCF